MPINPDNPYFQQEWHLKIIRAPEAYQVLRNIAQANGVVLGNPTDLTFGSAEVFITVIDLGLQTIGGVPASEAFQGNVSNGQPKVAGTYDFSRRGPDPNNVAVQKYIYNNNDEISGAHGVNCSGIAAGGVNYLAAPIAYGSTGALAGVAGNCRIIGIRKGGGLGYSFYWAMNANINYYHFADFGIQIPAGAIYRLPAGVQTDVISMSFVLGDPGNFGFDCTAFGRKGKGVLIFLAAGNANSLYSDAQSNRIMVVGATMIADSGDFLTEVRAGYSSYGTRLDFCAPAGGGQNDPGSDLLKINTTAPKDSGTFDNTTSNEDWNVTIAKTSNTNYDIIVGGPTGIFKGQYVAIGNPANNSYEIRRITNVVTTLTTQSITINKKFNNPSGTINLNNAPARIAYAFTLTTGPTTLTTIPVGDLKGFANGQRVYIFDGVNAEFATILSAAAIPLTLTANLAHAYPAGARVVRGDITVTATGAGSVSGQQTYIPVTSVQGFFVGQLVRVVDSVGGFDLELTVDGVNPPGRPANTLVVHANINGITGATTSVQVIGGGEYDSTFNGTSAATPIVAGASALVLSANKLLNWMEARHILGESAFKIDVDNTDPIGKWHDDSVPSLPVFTGGGTGSFFETTAPTTLSFAAATGDRTITLSSVVNVTKDVVLRLKDGSDKEFVVVTSVVGSVVSLDRALIHPYSIGGTSVKVGRKAYHSQWYGRGRIDLERAVIMARDWNVNDRDLWIRDFIGDNGMPHVNLAGIDSPDIWVRIINPATDGAAAIPVNDANPTHKLPIPGQNAWVYVRVRNRGTLPSLPGMEIILSYTDTADPNLPVQFPFPEEWQMRNREGLPFDVSSKFLTPIEGTFRTLAIPSIGLENYTSVNFPFANNPAVVALPGYNFEKPYIIPSIPAGGDHIAIIPWRGADIPTEVTGRTFLKVQITPFDGDDTVSGDQTHTNNNLTFKPLLFTSISLLDGGTLEKIEDIKVDTTGTTDVQSFALLVRNIDAAFVNNITIVITMKFADGSADQVVTYDHSSGSWAPTAPLPSWLQLLPPVFSGTAAPQQELTQFNGNLLTTNLNARVIFHTTVTDGTNVVLEKTTELPVVAQPPANAGGAAGTDPFLFHTFTDFDQLPVQSGTDNYGPVSDTQFRTAAMFTGIVSGTDLKAYAVTRGRAFIQEIPGVPGQVNLVLEPDQQAQTPFGRVKYFVYRGLKLSSFLQNSGGPVLADNPGVNNKYINRIWEIRHILDAKELALNPLYVSPGVKRDDVGLTTVPPPLADSTRIAEMFDANKFQIVEQGWHIGEFETTASYGFQVIVDGPYHEPILEDVRSLDPLIDITYVGGQPTFAGGLQEDILTKLKREKILSFIDPAAFIGLLAFSKIKLKNSTSPTPTELNTIDNIYSMVLVKFATKNKIYIDIRNELNNSLNFYGNYGDGTALNGTTVQFTDATPAVVPKPYHNNGWPLLILGTADFPANNTDDKLHVVLTLPKGDNTEPVLYLAGAAFYNNFPNYSLKYSFLTPGATYTNSFDLGILNNKTASVVMPAAIKIVYAKRYTVSGLPAPVYPSTVVIKHDLIDNLLAPADIGLVTPPFNETTWATRDELRYNGWTSHDGIDFTIRSGCAYDDIGETAFAFIQGSAEIQGGTSELIKHVDVDQNKGNAKTRTFLEHLTVQKLVNVSLQTIQLSTPVDCLRIKSVNDNYSINLFNRSADDLIMVAYTHAEIATIASATAVFLDGTSKYFIAKNHKMQNDLDGFPYFEMDLWVQGIKYNATTFAHEVNVVNTGLKLYSFDGRNYFTTAITAIISLQLPY